MSAVPFILRRETHKTEDTLPEFKDKLWVIQYFLFKHLTNFVSHSGRRDTFVTEVDATLTSLRLWSYHRTIFLL